MKGTLTVEASFVFPFCFLVILIICSLGIFKYNQAVLKLCAYECMLECVELWENSEDSAKSVLMESAEQIARKRVVGVEKLNTSVKATASKIMVSYSGVQRILQIPIEVTAIYERVYPEQSIRMFL